MIYEERKISLIPTLLLLGVSFLFVVSPWLLELRDLFWGEGAYAAMTAELDSFPPLLKLHGVIVPGSYPLYPLLVKGLSLAGFGMEFCLRIVPGAALLILCGIVFISCYRAAGLQAAAAGAAVMLSSLVIVDKVFEGNPFFLTVLGIFACWMVWFDFAVWRGRWNLAWIASAFLAGLTFYSGGWQALVLTIVPMLFLRRPLSLLSKPRGYGFAAAVLLILLFICLWGLPRWYAGYAGAFRPEAAPALSIGEYLLQLVTFPFDVLVRLFPWSLFLWAPFCPAIITLDKNPLLCRYLRTLFTVLLCILWLTPGTEGREIAVLVPPLSVLIGLNYWIAVRRYGARYLTFFKVAAWAMLACSAAALLFYFSSDEILRRFSLDVSRFTYRHEAVRFILAVSYCAGAFLLALLTLVQTRRKGVPVWRVVLQIMLAGVLLNWGVMIPYKATSRERRDIGLDLRRSLDTDTAGLTIYKSSALRGLYAEGHYMGGRIVTFKSVAELPSEEKTIYVLAPEVPIVPDRAWRNLLSREYRHQRLNLWKGELRQDTEL